MGILGAVVTAALIGGFGYSISALFFVPAKSSQTGEHVTDPPPSAELYIDDSEPFCSLVASPESVNPNQTYSVHWEGAEGGAYWFVNDTSRVSVDPTGSYEFVWDEKDAFRVFELKGEFNGDACTAYATVFANTEQPRCLIVTDIDLVEKGSSFRVSWFGYPETNTAFRVNGTLVDPRDAASYTFPEVRNRPIDFLMTGNNAEGSCEHLLTIWPN